MSDSVQYVANTTILDATLDQNLATSALPVTFYKHICVQVIWTSLTGTIDALIEVQGSNDATNWDNLTSGVTLSGANGNDLIMIDNAFCSYYRVKATKNNVTGGNLKAIVTMKE